MGRIYLSAPHMSGCEEEYVRDAFRTNWIAPEGPHVKALEQEIAATVGSRYAVATTTGTAALHLAIQVCGIAPGDEVVVSTLTFSASVNPIRYVGGVPILMDSEQVSWNMDPVLLADFLAERARHNKLPRAVVVAHIYGQCADLDVLCDLCQSYGVILIEDSAQSLGATYKGRSPGTFGKVGIFSFNGNKIITTSGGGMLVTDDASLAAHARKLATQAREPAPHYEHTEVGYNYRMSNVLAGIGRGQLRVLEDRVQARRRNFAYYKQHLGMLPGISFMPEAPWGRHTRWLTCILVDPELFGATREDIRLALEAENIEARPVWKPMHLQPVYADCERVGGAVAEYLFGRGLCLPSGSNLTEADLARVVDVVASVHMASRGTRP